MPSATFIVHLLLGFSLTLLYRYQIYKIFFEEEGFCSGKIWSVSAQYLNHTPLRGWMLSVRFEDAIFRPLT